jgi:hypothetical protein
MLARLEYLDPTEAEYELRRDAARLIREIESSDFSAGGGVCPIRSLGR